MILFFILIWLFIGALCWYQIVHQNLLRDNVKYSQKRDLPQLFPCALGGILTVVITIIFYLNNRN